MLITSHVSKVNCSERMQQLFFNDSWDWKFQVDTKEGQGEGSDLNAPVKSRHQHPTRAYPRCLTPSLAQEGGHLITHRGWGIWLLASISCYELHWFPHGLINHGGDKLWWIQRKRLRIHGGVVKNQRPTQALFRIWRCLTIIYIIYLWIYKYINTLNCIYYINNNSIQYWRRMKQFIEVYLWIF